MTPSPRPASTTKAPRFDLAHQLCRQLHVVDVAEHRRLHGREPLPPHEHAAVVAEPRHVDAEHLRRARDVLRRVRFLARRRHEVDGDEHVVRARREVAIELLPHRVLAHVLLQRLELLWAVPPAFVKEPAFIRTVHACIPCSLALCPLVHVVERILSLRRPDEHRPSVAVRERRTDDLVPELRLHLRVLVEDDAIPIRPAQGVRMVGAHDVDAAARRPREARRELDVELRLVHLHVRDDVREILEVVPCDVLRLVAERRDVRILRRALPVLDAHLDDVINRPNRLPKTTRRGHHREAMRLQVRMNHLAP